MGLCGRNVEGLSDGIFNRGIENWQSIQSEAGGWGAYSKLHQKVCGRCAGKGGGPWGCVFFPFTADSVIKTVQIVGPAGENILDLLAKGGYLRRRLSVREHASGRTHQ